MVVTLRCLLLPPFILFREPEPLPLAIEPPTSMSLALLFSRLGEEGEGNIESGMGLL